MLQCRYWLDNLLIKLVGAAGFEPAAPCSQSALKRALPEARIADTVLGVAKEPPSVRCRNFRFEFRHGPRGTSCRDALCRSEGTADRKWR
jgi:hypothetical protein